MIRLTITPALQQEMRDTIAEAERHFAKEDKLALASDSVYVKIGAAIKATKGIKPVRIEADESEIEELTSRIDGEIGRGGICLENIEDCIEFSEKAYWRGRKRAYEALLRQINAPTKTKSCLSGCSENNLL